MLGCHWGNVRGGISRYFGYSRYFEVLQGILGISRYFEVFQGISRYFEVFQGIGKYWEVFQGIRGISRYFEVFQSISRYFKVFQGIWRYFDFRLERRVPSIQLPDFRAPLVQARHILVSTPDSSTPLLMFHTPPSPQRCTLEEGLLLKYALALHICVLQVTRECTRPTRPLGRPPKGKQWDPLKGEWVDK